ncbi:hypothetical protein CU098_000108, partial [Rhizopus stolonifer]
GGNGYSNTNGINSGYNNNGPSFSSNGYSDQGGSKVIIIVVCVIVGVALMAGGDAFFEFSADKMSDHKV